MKARTFNVAHLVVEITVDRGQRALLASRSFRGTDVRKAGNFSEWNDAGAFLDDPEFRRVMLQKIVDAALANDGTFSVESEFEGDVGWTTVLNADDPWLIDRKPYDCAEEKLTNGVRADFVTDLPAPRTDLVTVIGQGRMSDERTLRIVLYNVRPGIATPPFPRPHRRGGRMIGGRIPDELGLVFWHFEDAGQEDGDDWLDDGQDDDEDEFDPNYYFDDILGTMVINGEPYDGPFPDDFDHSL